MTREELEKEIDEILRQRDFEITNVPKHWEDSEEKIAANNKAKQQLLALYPTEPEESDMWKYAYKRGYAEGQARVHHQVDVEEAERNGKIYAYSEVLGLGIFVDSSMQTKDTLWVRDHIKKLLKAQLQHRKDNKSKETK